MQLFHLSARKRSFSINFKGMALSSLVLALTTAANPLQAKNNNESSCNGLLTAVENTPPYSIARTKLVDKLVQRACVDDVDSDRDGLKDFQETLLHFTDPKHPDTDRDSLPDGWEVMGHPNGTPLPGANPLRSDIYVEMDYMVRIDASNGLGPSPEVLAEIEQVYANSPIRNPDGSTGISIHLELDEEVPYDEDLNPLEEQFNDLQRTYFDEDRQSIYHYMIWANGYNGGGSSGNAFAIPSATFVVTLGRWNGGAGGTDPQKIGTFIHELGHNLGLKHGGTDNINYKPNYISVMNYFFQVEGITTPDGVVFDYQRYDLPDLDESELDQPGGLNAGPEWAGYRTRYFCTSTTGWPPRKVALAPIDWDCDGDTSAIASGSVNRDRNIELLQSQNNWANLIMDGGGVIGSGNQRGRLRVAPPEPLVEEELTWQQHLEMTAE